MTSKRNRKKAAKGTLKRTPEQQRQIDELRRSGAAGLHASKRRRGTRRARKQRAIDDQL